MDVRKAKRKRKGLSKTDFRIWMQKGELIYLYLLKEHGNVSESAIYDHLPKTRKDELDRTYRQLLKSQELLLWTFGSPLFDGLEKPSYRKTKTIRRVSTAV